MNLTASIRIAILLGALSVASTTLAQATPAQAAPAQATPAQATPAQAAPAQAAPVQPYVPPQPAAQPSYALYADSEAAPAAPARKRHPGLILTIVGAGVFGVGYLGAVASYALTDSMNPGVVSPAWLIPIAGPWITLASTDWDRIQNPITVAPFIVIQGLAQATGLVLLTVGLSQSASSSSAQSSSLQLAVAPTPGGAFASARGTF